MLRYILIRAALFIPTLFIISVFAFFLYKNSPGDPVEKLLELRGVSRSADILSPYYEREYMKLSRDLGYDKRNFYLHISPTFFPDTLYKMIRPDRKKRAAKLLMQHQNWPDVQDFLQSEETFLKSLQGMPDSIKYALTNVLRWTDQNFNEWGIGVISQRSNLMEQFGLLRDNGQLTMAWMDYAQQVDQIGAQHKKAFIFPKLVWSGLDNQFHFWMVRLLKGDFGYSMTDGRRVGDKLSQGLAWTISMVSLAIAFSFLLSIPIGLYCAKFKDSLFDRGISMFLYLIFGLPVFWLATLMVVFFTTAEYGNWTNIFPSVAMNIATPGDSVWQKINANSSKLILPVFCLTLNALAYLSRQTRSGILEEINKPYTLTALAKGLNYDAVLWKHNLPNTMIALVTILFGAIPGAMAGSLVIEVIFNIPGMGRLMYQSIFNADWPVLYMGLLIFGIVTMVSYLLGDIFYAIVNPGIKYERK